LEKENMLDLTREQIEKKFGKGAIMKLGDRSARMKIDKIPTGALSLDIALGIGGVPRGRVTEIFGPEASGKTTLSLQIAAEAQKEGVAAFIDAEHALDPVYAKNLGVDVDNLLISQPDTGEQALEITEMLVRSGAVDVVIIDSVAALVPKAEIEGEMGDSHMGLQARLMSQALRKLAGCISKSKTSAIFINQLREKIGVVFGNPETTPGGRALKFYSSVRIDVRRIETMKVGTEMVGNRVRAKVVKNKVAPPFRQAEFEVYFGRGISKAASILDLAVEKGFITKSGSWYAYQDKRIGQGKDAARQFLEKQASIMKKLENEIKVAYGLTGEASIKKVAVKKEEPKVKEKSDANAAPETKAAPVVKAAADSKATLERVK